MIWKYKLYFFLCFYGLKMVHYSMQTNKMDEICNEMHVEYLIVICINPKFKGFSKAWIDKSFSLRMGW